MDNITLKAFPSSAYEYIAMLWIQQQDLTGKSSLEIADMYYNALSEIKQKYAAKPTPQKKPNPVRSKGIQI